MPKVKRRVKRKVQRMRFEVIQRSTIPGARGWLVRMVSMGIRTLTLPLSKSAAIQEAKAIAKRFQPSTLVIKKRDGKIQEERTYGDDPYPPKG